MKKIYLDNSASTPVEKKVFDDMLPYFSEKYGNASSLHFFGQEAQHALDGPRSKVAKFLNCETEEVFFTGSATEASNLAIAGLIRRARENTKAKPHIIISSIEHESILETVKYYTERGEIESTLIPVSSEGFVSCDELRSSLKDNTILVSVMHANNEIGTIQPIGKISQIIRKFNKENARNVLFHTDSAQSANFLDCDVKVLDVDMLTISGHKIYGPKGVGILFVKKGVDLDPLITGSKQESGIRSGTENIPAIVGIASALEIVVEERKNLNKMIDLRDNLLDDILKNIKDVKLNGSLENRVHSNLNISFKGIDKEDLLLALDLKGIAVSGGSACYSKSLKESHVLNALALSNEEKKSSIRISLGRSSTSEDMNYLVSSLKEIVENLRS